MLRICCPFVDVHLQQGGVKRQIKTERFIVIVCVVNPFGTWSNFGLNRFLIIFVMVKVMATINVSIALSSNRSNLSGEFGELQELL